MKKIILALVAVLAFSLTAKAEEDGEAKRVKGYNRVSIIYTPAFSNPTRGSRSGDVHTHHGVGASYVRGIGVHKRLPLYIEAGLTAQYYPEWKGVDLLRLSVPVNVTYRLAFGKDRVAKLSPFTGLNFGFNAINEIGPRYWGGEGMSSSFDSGEKVFQLGWMIGLNLTVRKINVGVAYCLDVMPLAKCTSGVDWLNRPVERKITSGNMQLSVGYEF